MAHGEDHCSMFSKGNSKSRGTKIGSLKRKEAIVAYLFLLPTLLGFIIFVIGPMFSSIWISFHEWDPLGEPRFIGLGNYSRLIHDSRVAVTYLNTIKFVIGAVGLNMLIALLLAVGINAKMGSGKRSFYRACFFLPVMVSSAAVAIIWTYLFDTDFGVINYYLGKIGFEKIPWLTSSTWSLCSIILLDVWKNVGFNIILFSAGLQNIPRHLYEAAALDGASKLQIFRHITLPMLSPTTFFALVMALIGAFQVFDYPYIMTQGGPGDSSRTVVLYLYEQGFRFFSMGYASTIALSLFLIILVLTVFQNRISERWVFYG